MSLLGELGALIVSEIWGGALNTNSKIVLYDQDYRHMAQIVLSARNLS